MTLKELGIALMLDLRELLLQKSHIHSTLIWMIVSQKIGVTLMAMKEHIMMVGTKMMSKTGWLMLLRVTMMSINPDKITMLKTYETSIEVIDEWFRLLSKRGKLIVLAIHHKKSRGQVLISNQ